jgi:hypothetical protein
MVDKTLHVKLTIESYELHKNGSKIRSQVKTE